MADSEFNLNPDVALVDIDDHLMPNAYPPRKMFSSTPANNGEPVSKENRNGGMTMLRKLAAAIKKDGKLQKPKS